LIRPVYAVGMGALEKKSKHIRRVGAFQGALLTVAALGAVVVVAGTVPNAAALLKYFPGYKKAQLKYQTKSALGRLVKMGLIVFVEKDGKRYARLTTEGKRVLDLEVAKIAIHKKRRWDRRWRIVIFDIPERRRSVRTRVRKFMGSCGFVRLQDSVWIYPHDCEDLIALMKAEFHIGSDVLYLIVEQLEHDKHLLEHFHLPLNV